MRYPKIILLSTVFLLALGFSCKKKDAKTEEWSSDKCILRTFSGTTHVEQTGSTYNIDASGKAINASTFGVSSTYEYDTDGYLVKISSATPGNSLSTSYIISGGNQVSTSSTSGVASTAEYYTDKKNTITISNRGQEFFGK